LSGRLALRRQEAARTLGVSDEVFDEHIRPQLRVIRCGRVLLYPVADIERWIRESSSAPIEDAA
jgi:hypothetical protein